MIGITLVYVIATIFICIFNYRTTQITLEQTKELRRQYDEMNRAFVSYELIFVKKSFYAIRITNHGRLVATDVSISIDNDYIESMNEESFKEILIEQKNRKLILGIGQSYDLFFMSARPKNFSENVMMKGLIRYKDYKNTYEEKFEIDLGKYVTQFSVKSDMETITDVIKSQDKNLKRINATLQDILKDK